MPSLIKILNVENVQKVIRNISKVGLFTTVRYVASDLIFDYKYHIDTINTKMLDELDIESSNKSNGHYYEGTNYYVFKQVFSEIAIDPSQSFLVDFGSGKGKAMCLAAELGFKKVTGVEFSLELVEICRKNLEIFQKKSNAKTNFEVIHVDAAEYNIPLDANVLFFYNPFNEVVIAKVIANIMKSYELNPRPIWILHLYPQGNMAFAKDSRIQLEHEEKDWSIYRLG